MVDIARKNLLHDRTRFIITVVGVTFSVVLIFSQFGIYLGFMENASIIIDNTQADIWSPRRTPRTSTSRFPSTSASSTRCARPPGWRGQTTCSSAGPTCGAGTGGQENIELVGFNPETGVGGPWRLLAGGSRAVKAGQGHHRRRVGLPQAGNLKVGDQVEINEQRVRVVGISQGVRGFTTAPYVFTSYRAAQDLDPFSA